MASAANLVRLRPRWRAILDDHGQARPVATNRADLITILLGAWFTVGLLLDAWAHNNVPELETFFTPWHGAFYSGFIATALWILWLARQNVLAGRRGLAAVPLGYGLALAALPVFAAAAVGDYLWHTFFGIEQALDILFSPTHLLLITSMVVIMTAPLRAAWADPSMPAAPSPRRALPAMLSTAFSATLVMLFLQYGNALTKTAESIVGWFSYPRNEPPLSAAFLAGNLVLTTIVLLAPVLLLARRWRIPPGAATLVYAAMAGLGGAVTGFRNLSTVVSILVAGVCVDLLAAWLRPSADRRGAYWAFAALAPLVTWTLYLAVASAVVGRLPSVVELWTGAPVVAALIGLMLGVLFLPNAVAEPVGGAAIPARAPAEEPAPAGVP